MDSESLRTFTILSRCKNFSKTAEALFVTQSTVTKRIAELERELDKKLFNRDKKHVTLTEHGRIFLSYAERILDLEQASMNEMNTSIKYNSLLRIGATNSIYECHLLPIIQKYIKSNTSNAVKISIGHSSDLLLMLQDGILDLVFSFLPFNKSGYECIKFHSDELVLVTNYNNCTYENGIKKNYLSEINYLMCNFALKEVGQFIRELFPKYYQFSFEIDNSTKLIPYIVNGTGYSFLPEKMVEKHIVDKQLRIVPLLDFETPVINSYYITRSSSSIANTFPLDCYEIE